MIKALTKKVFFCASHGGKTHFHIAPESRLSEASVTEQNIAACHVNNVLNLLLTLA